MLPSELGNILNVALRDLDAAISLTLTSVSKDSRRLQKLLNTALSAGRRHGAQLIEIHLPIKDFPHLGARFRKVPICDTGTTGVLRLLFEPSPAYGSLDAAA